MQRIVRWAVAGAVTVVAFAVPTWICGAVALPGVLEDSATRWGVASGLGVALAALAALWGHGFATGSREGQADTPAAAPAHPDGDTAVGTGMAIATDGGKAVSGVMRTGGGQAGPARAANTGGAQATGTGSNAVSGVVNE